MKVVCLLKSDYMKTKQVYEVIFDEEEFEILETFLEIEEDKLSQILGFTEKDLKVIAKMFRGL